MGDSNGTIFRAAAAVSLVVALAAPTRARGQGQNDSVNVVAAVATFHAALEAGDSTKALSLLAEDVRIIEGRLETKVAYRSGHLRSDMAFAKAVPSQRAVASVVVHGDVAWVASTSVTQGEYNGRAVNSAGTELMVLSRQGDGWKIRAIQWASRERRAP